MIGWGENNAGRITDKGGIAYFFVDDVNDTLGFSKFFSGDSGSWRSANNSITLSNWYHVAYTYDTGGDNSTVPIFYVNGVVSNLTVSQPPTGTQTSDTGNDLYIGNKSGSTRAFEGRMDNVELYNRILTPAEILSIYNYEK